MKVMVKKYPTPLIVNLFDSLVQDKYFLIVDLQKG